MLETLSVIAWLVPETIISRSVELGSISHDGVIEAPVMSRISIIFEPALPMSEAHWEMGTMSRRVIGGCGMPCICLRLFSPTTS